MELSRRQYLLAAGAGLGLAGCTTDGDSPPYPTDSRVTDDRWHGPFGTPDRTESSSGGSVFERVLDAVEDLGFDDTGTEPIDEAFAEAYDSRTLILFPPGTYLVDDEHSGGDVSWFGIRGRGAGRRDVRIVPTEGSRLKWLKAVDAGPHLIENLSFDERSDDRTQLSLWLTTSGPSAITNVEWLGRTPDDAGVEYTLTAEVTNTEDVFLIRNVVAGLDEPATTVEYPDGVAFLRCGPSHRGEVILRNPIVHGRNSNATRSSAPAGVLTIEGGEFVNNQNANIRFGAGDHPSKVSSATGTYVEVDGSRDSADAVRLDAGSKGYSGAVFRDLSIEWTKTNGRGVIAAPEWGSHGRAEFYDCIVRNRGAETLTVNAEPTAAEDDALVFENCSFTGTGRGFLAVDRPGSVLRNCCVAMPNASIDGFATRNLSRSHCAAPDRTPTGNP